MDKQQSFILRLKDVEHYVRRNLSRTHRKTDASVLADAWLLYFAIVHDIVMPDQVGFGRFTHTFLECTADFSTALRMVVELKGWDEVLTQTDFNLDALKRAMAASGSLGGSMWRALCLTAHRLVKDGCFAQLRTIFSFMSRITLREDPELDQRAITTFVADDEVLDSAMPEAAAWISRSWMQCFKGISHPKHGPGAVAEMAAAWEKVRFLGVDLELESLLRDFDVPVRQTSYITPRISRLICVPKSVDKRRTICSEPTTLQFYQQGVKNALVDYIDRHPYLSRRICLSHPELNVQLARQGSIDGSFATIDLSSASDTISLGMISAAFAGTWLKTALLATRSTHCDTGRSVIQLNKAFAMGSALCFPCECIIFAAICELGIRLCDADPDTSKYRVYGDDIVIETEYASAVITVLECTGFRVNRSKSFTSPTTRFRESCGGDFYRGMDAYPLRLSRRFSGYSSSSRHTQYESCVDLFNRAWPLYPSVRILLSAAPAMKGVCYGRNADACAFTTRENVSSPLQFDSDLQVSYTHGRVGKVRVVRPDQADALNAWLIESFGRTHIGENPIVTSLVRRPVDASRVGRVYGPMRVEYPL